MKNPYVAVIPRRRGVDITKLAAFAEARQREAAAAHRIELGPDEHIEPPLPEAAIPRLMVTESREVLRGLKAHGAPINYVAHDGNGAQARRLRQLERQRGKEAMRAHNRSVAAYAAMPDDDMPF